MAKRIVSVEKIIELEKKMGIYKAYVPDKKAKKEQYKKAAKAVYQKNKNKAQNNKLNSKKEAVPLKPGKVEIDFYSTREWLEARYRALQEFGRLCMCCGADPRDRVTILHVDHIKPSSKHWHLRLDRNNLQVLCARCNYGKSNYFEHDFRTELQKEKISKIFKSHEKQPIEETKQ